MNSNYTMRWGVRGSSMGLVQDTAGSQHITVACGARYGRYLTICRPTGGYIVRRGPPARGHGGPTGATVRAPRGRAQCVSPVNSGCVTETEIKYNSLRAKALDLSVVGRPNLAMATILFMSKRPQNLAYVEIHIETHQK